MEQCSRGAACARAWRLVGAVVAAGSLVGALSACGQAAPVLSDRDRDALALLDRVAASTSGVDPATVDRTECWVPSANPVEAPGAAATAWRVLCRVHWIEQDTGAERYQDTTCIGDFAADPMLDHCYRWTYYDLMPVFEDRDAVDAGPTARGNR
jgi:hypothetical protein